MKKPKRVRRKARFRVGEVVTFKEHRDGLLFRVLEVRWTPLAGYEYLELWSWHGERYLRPLTAKEIGPRRKRG